MYASINILESYAQFFNGSMWKELFTNPASWGLILTLIVMEGLLSSDNAIVLSAMVRILPEKQRKKALMYGLWGAYLFRFIAIGLGTALTKLWWIKVIGGLYLIWMMVKFFKEKFFSQDVQDENGNGTNEDEKLDKFNKGWLAKRIGVFWATVFLIEMTDITFSVDSVLAAFGVSDSVGILLIGGMLGILMMRGVAQLFTILIEKVPELEVTAYVIVGFIGVKMLLGTIGEIAELLGSEIKSIEITSLQFFIFLAVAFLVTFVIHFAKKKKGLQPESQS